MSDDFEKAEKKYRRHKFINDLVYPFRNTWWNIKNIISWLPILWNNWDWDDHYLLYVMEHKLKRMKRHHEKHGFVVASPKTAKEIGVVLECIKRIKENKYCDELYDRHEEKYGSLKYEFIATDNKHFSEMIFYTSKISKEQKELLDIESQERLKIHKHGEYLINQDYEYMFKFMAKHMRGWWD